MVCAGRRDRTTGPHRGATGGARQARPAWLGEAGPCERAKRAIRRRFLVGAVTLVAVLAPIERGRAQSGGDRPAVEHRPAAIARRDTPPPTQRDRALAEIERTVARGDEPRAIDLARRWSRRHRGDDRAALLVCGATSIADVRPLPETFVVDTAPVTRCVALLDEVSASSDAAAALRLRASHLLADPAIAFQDFVGRVTDVRDIERLRLIAIQAAARDDLDLALSALDYARRARPGDVDVLRDMALVWLARGAADTAVSHLRGALAARPNDEQLRRDLAGALVAARSIDEAVTIYSELGDHAALAHAELERSRPAAALDHARRALDAASDDDARYAALLLVGDAARLAHDDASARDAYRRALVIRPSSPRATAALADLDDPPPASTSAPR